MRILLGLLLVFCLGSCPAQRIFIASQDITNSGFGRPIKAIHPHWLVGSLASRLTVVYPDGGKQNISRDSIWGFEDSFHLVYRCYKEGLYRIDSVANLIYYTEMNSRGNPRYFSKGLDTALHRRQRAARADTMRVQP